MDFNDIKIKNITKPFTDAATSISDKYGSLFNASNKELNASVSQAEQDPFKVSNFIAKLKRDGQRLTKGYYYTVYMFTPDLGINELVGFHCNKINLPGWRAKTQSGKIYGISYEITTSIEQDPLWMSFSSDIYHKLESYFMNTMKIGSDIRTFGRLTYSPSYKHDAQFQILINVTDENFIPVYQYRFDNCILKTVQQINYSADASGFQEITIEVVYEKVVMDSMSGITRDHPVDNPEVVNKNQIRVGPFSSDISNVNLFTDAVNKIPDWFKGPIKI